MSPSDSDTKVLAKLEAEFIKWRNSSGKNPHAKVKFEILKSFKAALESNPNLLKEHADKYSTLIAQEKQQQEKSIREAAFIYVVNGQIEEAALAELAKNNSAFSKEEILSIIGATIKKKERV